ncbi:MAG: PilN domain-containing protein [Moraxellaceae bacterium]|nr:PilN domain-containing protein [Moraxellaceae bacterium]
MAKINLLPWRQELRKQRQQEFIAIVVAVAVLAVGIVLFAHMALVAQVGDQLERNQYIKNEIATLDGQIKEIDELQARREELLSRMRVIQDLQGRRPVIVRVFDELVRSVPDGVYFRSVERTGDRFKITGVAESNNQVSSLMRNLESSPWFRNPVLSNVAADQQAATKGDAKNPAEARAQGNSFALTVDLEAPVTEEVASKSGSAGKGGAK